MTNKFKTKEIQKIIFIIILVITCITISYYGHFIYKTEIAYTHFFYIPIILASIWWNYKGLLIPALISVMILITHSLSGLEWHFITTFFRISMFLLIGILVAILSRRRLLLLKNLNSNSEILETEILKRKEKENELINHKENLEKLVNERTEELETINEELQSNIEEQQTLVKELGEANKELERLNKLFIGREFRIKDLRDEIDKLKNK